MTIYVTQTASRRQYTAISRICHTYGVRCRRMTDAMQYRTQGIIWHRYQTSTLASPLPIWQAEGDIYHMDAISY